MPLSYVFIGQKHSNILLFLTGTIQKLHEFSVIHFSITMLYSSLSPKTVLMATTHYTIRNYPDVKADCYEHNICNILYILYSFPYKS